MPRPTTALSIALAASCLTACAHDADPRFEIDHVFVFSEPGGPETALFEEAGFNVSPHTNTHGDQGTTGRYVYFDNVYIELLWVHDARAAEANAPRADSDFNARQGWRSDAGVSPFGLGLRDHAYGEAPPAREHVYKADWMGERPDNVLGVFTPRERLDEPWVFRMPNHWTREPRTSFRNEWLARLDHPNGARRLTAIDVRVPSERLSPGLRRLASDGRFELTPGAAERVVVMTFDGGARGGTADFRPDLPLVIEY